MLRELCSDAGFEIEEITYVAHFFSQVVARLQKRIASIVGDRLQWPLTLPIRAIPVLLDGWIGRWIGYMFDWPGYCIALSAYKRRYNTSSPQGYKFGLAPLKGC